MTEKLYLQDSYLTEAEATIRKKDFRDGHFRICLDRTIFSPEGGGQPRDTGTINGSEFWLKGGLRILAAPAKITGVVGWGAGAA